MSVAGAGGAAADVKAVKVGWQRAYKAGLDADVWGQADEAEAAYTTLAHNVMDLLPHSPPQGRASARSPSLFSAEEVTALLRFHHCLLCRAQLLHSNAGRILDGLEGGDGEAGRRRRSTGEGGEAYDAAAVSREELSLEDMQRLTRVLDDLLTHSTHPFPIALSPATVDCLTSKGGRAAAASEAVISVGEEKTSGEAERTDDGHGQGGSLQPPGAFSPGSTSVVLQLLRVGLKDAEVYVNPHVSVVVTSAQGPPVEVQDTAFLALDPIRPRHFHVGCAVHLQTPLEQMREEGLSVFFEFRHWKAAKKKVSVRCFALMEVEEMQKAADKGEVALELYQKPTDWKKKHLHLLSVKPLYLHIACSLRKH